MRLSELMQIQAGGADPEIGGLADHSAAVRPGDLFAALKGGSADGARNIGEAVANGAVAILAEHAVDAPDGVAVVVDADPRRTLAQAAARFFGRQPATVVAVTGTNGKTSVAWFVRQLWDALGIPAASIGTLGVLSGGRETPLSHTTPPPIELHRLLAGLASDGIDHAVVEASSHGLAQRRLDGVRVAAAAITSISRDHFDYHTTPEDYFDAKMRLFRNVLAPGGTAVLNADLPAYPDIAAICRDAGHRIVSYGRHGAYLRVVGYRAHGSCQNVELELDGHRDTVRLPLVGDFQAWNVLCALALVTGAGGDPAAAVAALPMLRGVPGRVQEVAELNGGRVFVDYAHTPDALASCLRALRPHARNHLTVVFGCGGDRDRGKRPEMGRVACAHADRVIVTDDNPRSEDPAGIRREVMAGCERAVEVAGRAEAIEAAVAGLGDGDILLIAGKGHETSQIIGDDVVPFNDAVAARAVTKVFARVGA